MFEEIKDKRHHLYRETEEKIALRVSEGCVTVETEAATFLQYLNLEMLS